MFGSVRVKLVSVTAVRAGVHFPVVQVDVHLGRENLCIFYTLVGGRGNVQYTKCFWCFYTYDKLLHLRVAKRTTSTADLRKQDP